MPRPTSKHPTELELEILKILWRDGPSTVRDVRSKLEPFRILAHNSVMTVMGIMTEKGYLRRSGDSNGYVYATRVREQTTLRRMLSDLVQRAYSGSTVDAMLQLLDASDLDKDEIARLRTEINRRAKERDS